MGKTSSILADQKLISALRFGSTDARTYLNNPGQPMADFFRNSFFKSSHLAKITDPAIYFFIGEKGVGKTAYSAYATLFLDEYKAASEFFETNDFTRFLEVARKIELEKSQYALGWVFVFSVLILQKVGDRFKSESTERLDLMNAAIRSTNIGSPVFTISQAIEMLNDIDILVDHLFERVSEKEFGSAISLKGVRPSQKVARFIDFAISALAAMPEQTQFTIFIDGLDVRPDDVGYSDYLTVVSSICNAVWVLNATQLAKLPGKFKATILLRPDIFESVAIQNRGPKLQNHGHLVEWSAEYRDYRDSEIFSFTDRVFYSQQSEKFKEQKVRAGDTWDAYFPFMMGRHNEKEEDDPFILFIRHSFCKPRDVVRYLQLMQGMMASNAEATCFGPEVFRDRDVKQEFSSYLLQEIRDQLNFYYTNAEYQQFLDFCNGYLGRHIDRKQQIVEYSQFEIAHGEYISYNKKNNVDTVPSFATADITLQFMFDLNVLGYQGEFVTKDGKKRPFTTFSYRKRSFANLRPKVPTGGRYKMHYGVARSLFTELL